MGIVMFLIIGITVGWIAGNVVKGHGLGGIYDLVVGVVGSFIGGFVFDIFGIQTYGFWSSIFTSIIGAVLFLGIVALIGDITKDKHRAY